MVEHMLPRAYYAQSMVAAQADQRVLKDLIAERMPKINHLLDRMEVDLSLITFNWLLTVYVDCLPIESVLRVWDTFLFEGGKVPFRFALAIFKMNEAAILKQTDKMELFQFMKNLAKNCFDINALTKAAFQMDGWTGFSQKSIDEKRLRWNAVVRKELEELRESRERYEEGSTL